MSSNDAKRLKRIASSIEKSKGGRSSAIARLRSMIVHVPNKRMAVAAAASSTTGAKIVRGTLVGGPQGPERKKYETSNTAGVTVSSAAPYVQSLTNGIAQGTGVSNRIGDRIHVKGIDVQFQASAASVTAGTVAYMDVFLLLDTQPNGATPAANTIFETATTNLTYLELGVLERFKVLKRERMAFDAAGGVSRVWTWHQSCDLAIRFDTSTASPQSNDIYICALSPGTVAAAEPTLSYICRLSFSDE